MTDTIEWGLAIVIALAIFAAGGVAIIWALNTLFGLGIVLTVKTWMAALILAGVFCSSRGGSK